MRLVLSVGTLALALAACADGGAGATPQQTMLEEHCISAAASGRIGAASALQGLDEKARADALAALRKDSERQCGCVAKKAVDTLSIQELAALTEFYDLIATAQLRQDGRIAVDALQPIGEGGRNKVSEILNGC